MYLARMLERRPVVTWGFVSSLNGSRFFDVYSPAYGLECRLYTADVGVFYVWDSDSRCAAKPVCSTVIKQPDVVFLFVRCTEANHGVHA